MPAALCLFRRKSYLVLACLRRLLFCLRQAGLLTFMVPYWYVQPLLGIFWENLISLPFFWAKSMPNCSLLYAQNRCSRDTCLDHLYAIGHKKQRRAAGQRVGGGELAGFLSCARL